jgi:hypothetical protein
MHTKHQRTLMPPRHYVDWRLAQLRATPAAPRAKLTPALWLQRHGQHAKD